LPARPFSRRCLLKGASREQTARVCTNVLTKLAIKRGSMDNITVVFVDLRAASDSDSAGSELSSAPPTP
jgi:serine/threonine protein phosphatase PrpC